MSQTQKGHPLSTDYKHCKKCGSPTIEEWSRTVSNGLCGNCYNGSLSVIHSQKQKLECQICGCAIDYDGKNVPECPNCTKFDCPTNYEENAKANTSTNDSSAIKFNDTEKKHSDQKISPKIADQKTATFSPFLLPLGALIGFFVCLANNEEGLVGIFSLLLLGPLYAFAGMVVAGVIGICIYAISIFLDHLNS